MVCFLKSDDSDPLVQVVDLSRIVKVVFCEQGDSALVVVDGGGDVEVDYDSAVEVAAAMAASGVDGVNLTKLMEAVRNTVEAKLDERRVL